MTASTAEVLDLFLYTIFRVVGILLLGSCITYPELLWRSRNVSLSALAAYPDAPPDTVPLEPYLSFCTILSIWICTVPTLVLGYRSSLCTPLL
ncbi:hypothetical protein COCNU_scaffold054455G000010 [Cocos nucifera]|nr:hypothetical protein [Cocos nucifera]